MDGWLVVDKPEGITSNRAVTIVRRATGAKTGHAGTLDPFASGILPIALGEATKTVRFASEGRKRYRFTVRWGVATDTEDREGAVTAESATRPTGDQIAAALPRLTGTILQRPPTFSALKVDGRRAYKLARAGKPPELAPRPVDIVALDLVGIPDPDHAEFAAEVGSGTYIRALARDLAEALGTVAHVIALRRTQVGRFTEALAISLDLVALLGHSRAASEHLLPLEFVLDDIPALVLTADEVARLRHGQQVTPRDPRERAQLDRLDEGTIVGARHDQLLIAVARIENGCLRPVRIINR
ncbi:MAG TPA: tRNA pseudouridine(55) synthase TruB [Stellaceae bacterium]|jgi:tRNA pseudouridine55 synthase|nr:tRNA pseudouridine(55) synthase TruB [Stellaceae bacterium]